MMLSGTSYFLPLLVLLSAGQSMAGIADFAAKQGSNLMNFVATKDPTFEYGLGRPGALGVEGLSIDSSMSLKEGAYITQGKYFVKKDDQRNVRVLCGNSQTENWTFRLFKNMYSGDYNMFETPKPTPRPPQKGYDCYVVLNPGCGIPLYNYFRPVISDLKSKQWWINGDQSRAICITQNAVVVGYANGVVPINSIAAVDRSNDELWKSLAFSYKKFNAGLMDNQAEDYVKKQYKDLAITTNKQP
ncbi:hypothetical protein BDF19DRAFT_437462 [Syncephalis fuscata]|nr:hypothetical protein BDF19DRAFT_437462 [Syncephalis fuscata]